jgi:hypothetical protein
MININFNKLEKKGLMSHRPTQHYIKIRKKCKWVFTISNWCKFCNKYWYICRGNFY